MIESIKNVYRLPFGEEVLKEAINNLENNRNLQDDQRYHVIHGTQSSLLRIDLTRDLIRLITFSEAKTFKGGPQDEQTFVKDVRKFRPIVIQNLDRTKARRIESSNQIFCSLVLKFYELKIRIKIKRKDS